MITKETAVKIFNCYIEIEKGEKLLVEIEERLEKNAVRELNYDNAFGERVGLQLGVPSGPGSHTLYGVRIELGKEIIAAHIVNKQQQLKALQEVARQELDAYDLSPMEEECEAKSEKYFLCYVNTMEIMSFYRQSPSDRESFSTTRNVLDATVFNSFEEAAVAAKYTGVFSNYFKPISEDQLNKED